MKALTKSKPICVEPAILNVSGKVAEELFNAGEPVYHQFPYEIRRNMYNGADVHIQYTYNEGTYHVMTCIKP